MTVAVNELVEACDALNRMGDRSHTSRLFGLLAEAQWRCGDHSAAAGSIQVAREAAGVGDVISQVRWRSVLTKLSAAEGVAVEALQLSAEAVQLVSSTDEVTTQGDVLTDAAEVQELLGNIGAAQVLLGDAVKRYERKGASQAIRVVAHRLYVRSGAALQSVPPPAADAAGIVVLAPRPLPVRVSDAYAG